MGWFDNDDKDRIGKAPSAPQAVAPPPTPARVAAGSTLGERVYVNGTITCDEDLTILGKVEGQIHAREKLLIAKQAEVQALIKGTKVLVEGTVKGDVHAAGTLVLGATASLIGNIKTPSLQVRDGAYFKGSVEMEPAAVDKPVSPIGEKRQQEVAAAPSAEAARPPTAAAAKTARKTPASAG